MTMDYAQDLQDLVGRKAVDPNGDKVGTVSAVYVDEDNGEPSWVTVTTGWFGSRISFVPLQGTYIGGDEVVVGYTKDTIKDAPNFDADGHLDRSEEDRLYQHYGLSGSAASMSTRGDDFERGTTSRGTTSRGRTKDDAMTRSEEEVNVSKRQTEAGRARLRKWIETEQVQMTVPIRREKARLVTEPITDRNRDKALDGPDLTESEHEIVLNEEQVDVEKRVVPKERVRLEKEVETEDVPVDESVRKERIEMDRDDAGRRR